MKTSCHAFSFIRNIRYHDMICDNFTVYSYVCYTHGIFIFILGKYFCLCRDIQTSIVERDGAILKNNTLSNKMFSTCSVK